MKVYDVRNLKAQTPIGFSQHPTSCRFVAGMEGCVCVSTGSNKATLFASLTFSCDSVVTAASGQAIGVFYNSFSPFVQIFCNSIDPPFSLCDDESVFPSERDLEPFIPFDSDTSLAAFPLVYLQRGQYCSDRWSDSTSFQHFLNTKPTSPEMMEQFKKGVEYFKSPYANTIVSGFNVWSYGKRTAVVASTPSPRQPPPPPSRVEESTSAGAENGAAASSNMANSIMERYQNAAEFVPGRQKHQHSRTPDRATSTTPKPPPPSAKPSEAAIENAEAPPKAATCLPSMTFDQLRAMAEALKSEGKATK
ncbi:hypothetical protein M3Y99_00310700 [Aphelenchoides fujianensis]|nr:hypothetical protein M3Y99_00310700 [Aphelenchoides fujianensis]